MQTSLLITVLGLALAAPPTSVGDTAIENLEKKVADLERQLAEVRQELQALRRLPPAASDQAGDGVAWGQAAGGLQAGLALRPKDKSTFEVGEAAQFVVKVRNVSDRAVEMPWVAVPAAAKVGQSVLDDEGNRPPGAGPGFISVGGRAINKLMLSAGQEVEFAAPQLIFGPVGESRLQEKSAVLGGPGKFHVSYHVYYLNPDETGNYITTGELIVEVVPSAVKSP